MEQYVRQTAFLARVQDIVSGKLSENAVELPWGPAHRVTVLGVLVARESERAALLEDGTGSIMLQSFDRPLATGVGNVVQVVGRPKEFNGQRYLVLDACKPVGKSWIAYRKRELEHFLRGAPAPVVEENPLKALVRRVRELDTGIGADAGEVLRGVADGETMLRTLIEAGELFEIRPGRVKVLE